MSDRGKPELLLLHALPLDGSMWAGQMGLLPGSTYAPTLYPLGDRVEEWAAAALKLATGNRLIIVGCSVGGSCALEIAAAAPDRVAALVLIGTKAKHRPDPLLHLETLELLRDSGLEDAWERYWAPLFANCTASKVIEAAKHIALSQNPTAVADGVTAFHSRPSRDHVLSGFPRPIYVLTGVDDPAPGLKVSAEQAEAAQQGQLHIIPESGHYVPLEQPERLNEILRTVIAAQQYW